MNKLYIYMLIFIVGIMAIMLLPHYLAPDFEAMIEENPTAAGEKRPGYFRSK